MAPDPIAMGKVTTAAQRLLNKFNGQWLLMAVKVNDVKEFAFYCSVLFGPNFFDQ